ncbi:DUF1796 family putative cysteine peptidase [Niallia sp. 03133]|uniref:DUF1796 family putative cysteine peptidase n=1 Tax=Niallia sp. 03133 TaxID=3458060 RepID=UPI004044F576
MNLEDVKGSYDLFISLGSWCGPSLNLRRHQLRRFSFPLDWSISNSLQDVNQLIKTHFEGFMELNNMEKTEGFDYVLDDGNAVFPDAGGELPVKAHFIKDNYSNIISVHDFPIIPNQDWTTHYDKYKEKLTIRINRFYEKLQEARSILFIRWGIASYQEMLELQTILTEMIPGKFKVIILHPTDSLHDINPIPIPLEHICYVQFPSDKPNDDAMWNKVMEGLLLTNY